LPSSGTDTNEEETMPNRAHASRRRLITAGAAAAVVAALAAGYGLAATAAAPNNTKAPSIAGSPIVGKELDGNRGDWAGTGTISYANRWIRCDKNVANCVPINGATGDKYTLVSADLGSTIRFEVKATNNDGTTTANSAPTDEVTNGNGVPASSSPPTISGSAVVGNTLTAGTGSWVGDQPITYSYQWQQCDKNGNACKNIGPATKETYKVVQGDVSHTLRVKVVAKNARGKSNAISNQTSVVQDSSGGGGGGLIDLPGGGKSVDVVDVPKGERLIVDKVTFSPSPVTSRNQSITVKITVKDTRGYFVRNAYVFLRSTPIVTSTPTDAQTSTDGTITYTVQPESDFPVKNGYAVQFYVKAYRKGDPSLAGISGTRLVQVATAKP
jgi:hypothetical protein